ncbi:hypothetical protein FKW77_005684 [Venturia effusa]|uniref:Major facilitator superfamily (MFS) profile domain-containing protein n=1 Tax=Venturia effusa TaxID=50376 RepID=A0A517KZG9_9PEZI|nr:hypothetical protein FKW77_005684 [Venturia effusa]
MAEKPGVEELDYGRNRPVDAPEAIMSTSNKKDVLSQQHTYYDVQDDQVPPISEEHTENYLIQRHGTCELDPLPSADPADPYNWPEWKKTTNLMLVAFNACMATFIAAGIIPAFEDISLDLGCSLQRASYLTSMQIAILGFAPLFWKPISNRYGRRPVWLISTLCSAVCNVGCAVSPSYATMALCRCLVAFFICPASAIGSGVVVETCFKKERAQKMGIWTLMVTLGPPAGPFFMGFVAYHVGYRWIYYVFAIINGVQFVAYLFFGPETRYLRVGVPHNRSAFQQEYLSFRRLDPARFRSIEFIQPIFLAKYLTILIPTITYSIVFNFASVFLTVEIPQIFLPKFGLNAQQIGLQFLGMIVGSIIGEQLAGRLSDLWMRRATARALSRNKPPVRPEYRLWLSYAGYLLTVVGLVVFGVRTSQAREGHWNVTPIVGIAISSAGNQIITTVMMTYAVDCHPDQSSSIGVFVNLVRSTWAFIGPFWFPDMIESLGVAASCGLMAGLIVAASVLPTIASI